jgi:hypothetical protein
VAAAAITTMSRNAMLDPTIQRIMGPDLPAL